MSTPSPRDLHALSAAADNLTRDNEHDAAVIRDVVDALTEAAHRIAFLEERISFYFDQVEAKRAALRASSNRIETVLKMHHERDWRPLDGSYIGGSYCKHCRRPWPCSTYRAATADTAPQEASHD